MRFEIIHPSQDGLAREVWFFELDRFPFASTSATQIAVKLVAYASETKPTTRHRKWKTALWYDPSLSHRSPGHLPHRRINKEQDVPWSPELGAEALAFVQKAIVLVEPARPALAPATGS